MFNTPTFSLENFEGPLELLLHLIQKEEIDVCSVAVKRLTAQFIALVSQEAEVDTASEALLLTATLLLMKSQKLLPSAEDEDTIEEESRIALIQSLIDYCHFKDAAKALSLREEEQKAHFLRPVLTFRKEPAPGLDEIALADLKELFANVLKRAAPTTHIIREEKWNVAQMMQWWRNWPHAQTAFEEIFSEDKDRMHLIVLFLALLEMMKHQELRIVRESANLYICKHESRA